MPRFRWEKESPEFSLRVPSETTVDRSHCCAEKKLRSVLLQQKRSITEHLLGVSQDARPSTSFGLAWGSLAPEMKSWIRMLGVAKPRPDLRANYWDSQAI